MQKITNAEILSPAGNMDMLIAAVRSGADAVYLGANEFSARRNAQNFDLDELKTAVEYCHIRGVRVYLALNIIIKENELSSAFSLAKKAYNLGIDGVIVADLGLARILHENIPNLKLHASTQMSVHSPSALYVLKELGFVQVVAGREMSKSELKELCKTASSLGITVEAFVHGALCMCVSGQCLLSAFLGSRSGNRGLCAGPCRLPFKAPDGTGYDLSLKDLSLIEHLTELYEAGVKSFKIEGRMKRPEYVAVATAACRKALYDGFVDNELSKTLKNVFSRSGFTSGYFLSKLGSEMFGIRTKEDVVGANGVFPSIHELYRFERKSIGVNIFAEILPEKNISVSFDDGVNFVAAEGEAPKIAKNRPTTMEEVEKSLTKLGSTPYFAENIEINLGDNLFVSAGELNKLRRDVTEKLDQKRKSVVDFCDKDYSIIKKIPAVCQHPKTLIRVESFSQIPDDLSGIEAVIFPLELITEKITEYNIPFIADIPRGIVSEKKIEEMLLKFKAFGGKKAMCGNIALIHLVKKAGLLPIGDLGLNIANSEAMKTLEKLEVFSTVISCEEQISDIAGLNGNIEKGIIAYGNIPLMLFRNCPLKNGKDCKSCDKNGYITDRLGIEFPVRCRAGYSELLNSVPIYLADRKNEINVDFIILYFTRENSERVKEVIKSYKEALPPDVKYSRGLYYRGTI